MDSLSYWLLFLSAALVFNLSPGPDWIYILSRTIAQGRRIGIASTLGVCTGALVHVLAAAFGLSAILATSAMAFTVVKYLGAAYLVYLGIQALRSRGIKLNLAETDIARVTFVQAFKQGVLVDLLNPKVAIFFMAFLPQFVRAEIGHASVQIVILGLLVILVAIVVEVLLVLIAARVNALLRGNRSVSAWLDRVLGSIFIGLGVRLALTKPLM